MNKFFTPKYQKKLTFLFFLIFFISGIFVVKDYGVSSDEYSSRIKGFVTLNYLGEIVSKEYTKKIKKDKNIPDIKNYEQKIYGVVFEAPASFLEIIFKIKDKKNQFILRHYLNFLVFFIGVVFFYKILKLRFENWFVPLIGSIILVLSPRIFANSFYNNKDLVFLSFFIISSFYAIKFINNQNFKNSLYFSIFAALAIDVRILGILIPILVFFINNVKNLVQKSFKEKFFLNLSNLFLVFLFVIIFWPYLWESPVNNFIFAFKGMANFEIETFNLFFSKIINAKNVPWYFIPIWILITTPILYVILFLSGLYLMIYYFFQNKILNLDKNNYIDIFFISTLSAPLIAVVLFNSTLYNGWRQMYFVYPSIIFISSICINYFYNLKSILIKKILLSVLILYSFNVLLWIIKNHPHQYVYFNETINKKNLENKFDLDYWGLSYKENFEYILNNDKKEKIKIFNLSHNKLFYALLAIDENSRERFIVVDYINDADYIFNNFYMKKLDYIAETLQNFKLVNEILVDNFSINSLYKKINF